jgi:hypothetical protein
MTGVGWTLATISSSERRGILHIFANLADCMDMALYMDGRNTQKLFSNLRWKDMYVTLYTCVSYALVSH